MVCFPTSKLYLKKTPPTHPQSFVTGPKFCGLKMIPPGVHFVAYAATGGGSGGESAGGAAPTAAADASSLPTSSGVAAWFWLDVAPASITVRRWCGATELLLPLGDADEAGRFAAGVRRFDFDAGLAPYNLGGGTTWQALTVHVTPATTRRIMGRHPNCSVAAEADPAAGRPPTAAETALDAALAAGRRWQEAPSSSATTTTTTPGVGAPTFTHFPRVAPAPRGAPPSAATAANVDKSGLLASILTSTYRGNPNALLGELEAAFVSAWAGHSLSALAAWGDGVCLLLGCTDAAVGEHAALFGDTLTMLRVQLGVNVGGGGGRERGNLQHTPPSTLIDADALLEDAFLKRSLRGFYAGLAEAGGGPPEVQVREKRAECLG